MKFEKVGSKFCIYDPDFDKYSFCKNLSRVENLFQYILNQYENEEAGTVYYQPAITYDHDKGFTLTFFKVYAHHSIHTIATHNGKVWNLSEDLFTPNLYPKVINYRNKIFDFYEQFFNIAKTNKQSCLQLLIDDFRKQLPYYFDDLKMILIGSPTYGVLEVFGTDLIYSDKLEKIMKGLDLILSELKTDFKRKQILESVKQI
jgi:hypothetical protein